MDAMLGPAYEPNVEQAVILVITNVMNGESVTTVNMPVNKH